MGPMFRDFLWKSDPLEGHIPYVLICEYPPSRKFPWLMCLFFITLQCLVDLAKVKQEETLLERYTNQPELLERKMTQEDLLSEAMNKLSVDKLDSHTSTPQTGKETAV